MGTINFKELSKISSYPVKYYTYTDLHLDIKQVTRGISDSRPIKNIKLKDIQASYDEEAIVNSLFNILNTRPMQRILLPTFGCDLIGYVGMPITTTTAQMIGDTILRSIEQWEPRITIDNILVVAKPDDNEYDITINLTIPSLKKKNVNILATLAQNGILESRMN